MTLQTLFGVFSALSVFHLALTYPYGAPDQACADMMPMHYVNKSFSNPLNSPQQGMPYFSIHVDKTYSTSPGEWIQVTIKADDYYFEGFLIQARNIYNYGEQLGEFVTYTTDTQTACMRKAVTHSDHKKYLNATFHWIVPSVGEHTCVNFVATIVKGYSTFFMGVSSEMVCMEPAGPYDSASDSIRSVTVSLLFLVAMATALFARR